MALPKTPLFNKAKAVADAEEAKEKAEKRKRYESLKASITESIAWEIQHGNNYDTFYLPYTIYDVYDDNKAAIHRWLKNQGCKVEYEASSCRGPFGSHVDACLNITW